VLLRDGERRRWAAVILVSGWLRVAPADRLSYLDGCRDVVEAARATPGCLDFSLAPDLLDDGRINVFEQWESLETVERFRGSGTSEDQQAMILEAHVDQHIVTGTTPLT
jgi:quinol monooxygenase YgiN